MRNVGGDMVAKTYPPYENEPKTKPSISITKMNPTRFFFFPGCGEHLRTQLCCGESWPEEGGPVGNPRSGDQSETPPCSEAEE